MATFLVYGQFYPYVNPVPRSRSNNRSQAIAILASVLCKKMRLAIPIENCISAVTYYNSSSCSSSEELDPEDSQIFFLAKAIN